MVPYVRKSFTKHLKDGLKYIEKKSDYKADRFEKWLKNDKNHPDGVIHFDDEEFKNLHPDAWEYAMDVTRKEVYQAVEGMFHNLNTLQSRSGNQLPFTSINYGTCTLPEGRMVIKALLDVAISGIGKLHKTSVFPCCIFQYDKDTNGREGSPNHDLYRLALESTTKRLYPNYCNLAWSNQRSAVMDDRNMKQEVLNSLTEKQKNVLLIKLSENQELADMLDIIVKDNTLTVNFEHEHPYEINSTMGCRTWNGSDINYRPIYEKNIQSVIQTGKLYNNTFLSAAQKDGRGNICPCTIIMPTIAMEAKAQLSDSEDLVEKFMSMLDVKIHEAKDMLIERFNWICSQSPDSAKFMYENGTMEGYEPEEGIRSALKHGTLALGQIGLAETLQILVGKDHTTKDGFELGERIEKLFNTRCSEFKHEYSLNFGVYFTPAENLCYTAMKKFKEKYGVIPNVSDRDFFTNSVHCPVWKEIDAFEKIDTETKLGEYSNAGQILYCELDASVLHNIDALEKIVDYAMDANASYFAINVPNDTCLECGFTGEFNDCCPMCGSQEIQQLRRVTGYLTGNYKTAFNKGKQQEVEMRVKHTGIEVT